MRRSKKGNQSKNLTTDYLRDDLDDDERVENRESFNLRSRNRQVNKTQRTADTRSESAATIADMNELPMGTVLQVHSVYVGVEHANKLFLCVVPKTLTRTRETRAVVGDVVRFTPTLSRADPKSTADVREEGVIQQIEPRKTILTRAEVRGGRGNLIGQVPMIANAQQMMIVISLLMPHVKWGLVDRMIIAAKSGGLAPIICLNKIDLAETADNNAKATQTLRDANEILEHYATLGVRSVRTSAGTGRGIDELRLILADQFTVLAGHSGVGKSSLIAALAPRETIRVGEISNFNQKGRHTTTSAKLYDLPGGGRVADTPGVKLFGLWDMTVERLKEFFPDVADGTAPDWRVESFHRIEASLG